MNGLTVVAMAEKLDDRVATHLNSNRSAAALKLNHRNLPFGRGLTSGGATPLLCRKPPLVAKYRRRETRMNRDAPVERTLPHCRPVRDIVLMLSPQAGAAAKGNASAMSDASRAFQDRCGYCGEDTEISAHGDAPCRHLARVHAGPDAWDDRQREIRLVDPATDQEWEATRPIVADTSAAIEIAIKPPGYPVWPSLRSGSRYGLRAKANGNVANATIAVAAIAQFTPTASPRMP